eukprot:3941568-Rhodomonas_salina.2
MSECKAAYSMPVPAHLAPYARSVRVGPSSIAQVSTSERIAAYCMFVPTERQYRASARSRDGPHCGGIRHCAKRQGGTGLCTRVCTRTQYNPAQYQTPRRVPQQPVP